MTDTAITPFNLAVPQSAIDDLHARLDRIRWPDEAPDAPWAYGSSLAFMREMAVSTRRNGLCCPDAEPESTAAEARAELEDPAVSVDRPGHGLAHEVDGEAHRHRKRVRAGM